MSKGLVYIVILCCATQLALGQKKAQIRYLDAEQPQRAVNFSFSDTTQFALKVEKAINELRSDGYLLAMSGRQTYDSSGVRIIDVHIGNQYTWLDLAPGNLPEVLYSKSGYNQKHFKDKPFEPKRFGKLVEGILKLSQNTGFPFASLQLDSIKINDSEVKASINYNPGPFITFDSLSLSGNGAVKKEWLQAYLGITPQQPFNQEAVDRIESKIKNLQFIKLKERPTITFQNEVATVHLNLEKIKSNQIDGIIGFLPNEKSDGSTLITGQFDMVLNNIFNSGKRIDVHWQSLKPKSQLLDMGYRHPNLFHSPLHFESSFYLLKEDSTFVNRKGRFEFQYTPSNHWLSFFTRLESSRLLLNDTDRQNSEDSRVDEITDFNITYYGLSHQYRNVSATRVPNGLLTYFEAAIGNKTLRNLDEIQTVNLNEKSTQYLFHSKLEWYRSLSKSLGIALKFNGGKLINDQLFLNDLFRLGGIESVRGFNESFYFASEYAVGTAELRYHYDQASYFFLFADQSYMYYNLKQNRFEDYPLGVGAGLSLQTKRGRLNLVYALGKSDEQPLSFSLSKFHFGYVANF
ncbi:MAG: BamA/TamA family outer membrane protein [Fulvivirga sp.]